MFPLGQPPWHSARPQAPGPGGERDRQQPASTAERASTRLRASAPVPPIVFSFPTPPFGKREEEAQRQTDSSSSGAEQQSQASTSGRKEGSTDDPSSEPALRARTRWWRRARAAEREQASNQAASQQQSTEAERAASAVKYFPIRRPTASMRKFLRESTSQELSVARKMASLSAFAYFMSSVTERSLYKSYRFRLVVNSVNLKRVQTPAPNIDRNKLAAALIASPAAPPFTSAPITKGKTSPPASVPAPRSARRAVTTKLLKNGSAAPGNLPVPSSLIQYLPADAVDRVFSARLAGSGTAEETRAERALDEAVEAILKAAAEEEKQQLLDSLSAGAGAAAPAGTAAPSRVFGLPSLDPSGPIIGAVGTVREQLFTRPVSTASAYITSLAAIAAPLAANAAAGSLFAAQALAAAARPLASAAVTGSSAAAQALGVIIEPFGAAAAAGGSVAGSTLATISGTVASAAAAAAVRVVPFRRKDAPAGDGAGDAAGAAPSELQQPAQESTNGNGNGSGAQAAAALGSPASNGSTAGQKAGGNGNGNGSGQNWVGPLPIPLPIPPLPIPLPIVAQQQPQQPQQPAPAAAQPLAPAAAQPPAPAAPHNKGELRHPPRDSSAAAAAATTSTSGSQRIRHKHRGRHSDKGAADGVGEGAAFVAAMLSDGQAAAADGSTAVSTKGKGKGKGGWLGHPVVSGTVRTVTGTVRVVGGWLGFRRSSASAASADASLLDLVQQQQDQERAIAIAAAASSSSGVARVAQCPSEWFVADDERSRTRYFVIQGSDSIASWKANLAFDPVPFEGTRIKVHRGVYEASLALYDTLMPYIEEFAERNKRRAFRLSFTGHSLGGSLATVVVLLISMRRPDLMGYVEPVWTFGAPHVLCADCCGSGCEPSTGAGGVAAGKSGADGARCQGVLEILGLAPDLVRNVMMHLDIVPRAFTCDYRLVQNWLRRIGGSFRDHSCLQGDGLDKPVSLYMPVGVQMVLQPSETAAAQHVMLPQGSGLWKVVDPNERLLWGGVFGGDREGSGQAADGAADAGTPSPYRDASEALFALMNSPHPLDILADVAAYGPQGTVSAFHNPFNYSRALANEVRRRNEWRKSLEKGAGAAVMRAAHVARVAQFKVRRSARSMHRVAANVATRVLPSSTQKTIVGPSDSN